MTIEEVLEITNTVANVDGEDVYIIENHMCEELERLRNKVKERKGRGSWLFEQLGGYADFICSHSDFAIIFRPLKYGDGRKWLQCLVYKYQDEWRRVLIQYAKCFQCDWTGSIACPVNTDLYITMENWLEILRKMDELPFLNCPKCGGEISSKAIWIEESEE